MERRQHRLLSRIPTRDEIQRLETLLAVDPATATSRYQSLSRGPRRISGPGLVDALDRLAAVRALGGPWDLGRIPALRLARLAAELDFTSVRDLRRMPGTRRRALLVACVHRLRRSAQDDALVILDHHLRMLMSSIVRKEREARLGNLRNLDRAARDLARACGPLLDPELADDAVRAASFQEVPAARLEAARRTIAETLGGESEGLARLAERRIELRRILPRLLGQLELEANPLGQELLEAWRYLARLEGRRRPDLGMAPTGWLRGSWRALVWKPDGTLDRTLYCWAVLDRLRDAPRRRDVYAPESLEHRDPRRQLLEGPRWSIVRPDLLRALGLPETGAEAVECLTVDLARAYRKAEAALDQPGGTRLVWRPGRARPSIPQFEGREKSPSVAALERRVAVAMPPVDLSELLLEVDAWIAFTYTMVEARRGSPRGAGLGRSLCAALLAQACNLGLRAVSSPQGPALRLERLEWVRAHYLVGEAILAANARLVDAQSALPVAGIWGDGQVASADGVRFVVPVQGPHAMPKTRYFGRRRGITYYNFDSDQYSGCLAIVLPGERARTPRRVGAAQRSARAHRLALGGSPAYRRQPPARQRSRLGFHAQPPVRRPRFPPPPGSGRARPRRPDRLPPRPSVGCRRAPARPGPAQPRREPARPGSGRLLRPARGDQPGLQARSGRPARCAGHGRQWNTLYLGEVVDALRRDGLGVEHGDLAQISPLLHAHIQMTDHYRFDLPPALVSGARRRIALPVN